MQWRVVAFDLEVALTEESEEVVDKQETLLGIKIWEGRNGEMELKEPEKSIYLLCNTCSASWYRQKLERYFAK